MHGKLRRPPILLLDDLFATIDKNRSQTILNQLVSQYQTVISTMELSFLDGKNNNIEIMNHTDLSKGITCQA